MYQFFQTFQLRHLLGVHCAAAAAASTNKQKNNNARKIPAFMVGTSMSTTTTEPNGQRNNTK